MQNVCKQGSESGFCWPLLNASKQRQHVVKSLLSKSMTLLLLLLLTISNSKGLTEMWTIYYFPCKQNVTTHKWKTSKNYRLLRSGVSLTLTSRWRGYGGHFQIGFTETEIHHSKSQKLATARDSRWCRATQRIGLLINDALFEYSFLCI